MAITYTVSWAAHGGLYGSEEVLEITYLTSGQDGEISTDTDAIADGRTYTQLIRGRNLKIVEAFPTSGLTAPDAADVTVKDSDGMDLLVAGGTNLIHATNKLSIYPIIGGTYPQTIPIRGALTTAIANQGTASAEVTIRLTFVS